MPKNERKRIDYRPVEDAVRALTVAKGTFPALRTQALVYHLTIVAVSAFHHAVQYKPW